jgi:PKD domain
MTLSEDVMETTRRPSGGRGAPRCGGAALAVVLTAVLTIFPARAAATIAPATTIDGPAGVVDFGGVAMAPDGGGAVVYRRLVDGTPHVFAARFSRQRWSEPVRVDGDAPYAAATPRVAAASGGRLLVVWTQAYATLANGTVRHRLMSARLAPGTAAFGEPLVVDPDVRTGVAVDPSLAITPTGRAFAAYRVVTGDQTTESYTPLRPGDVLGEVRVAFLDGRTWSALGAVNRNPAATMRKPDAANAPRIAGTPTGGAVVAWQEPDVTTGVARVYARRVFANRLGNVLAVSPEQEGDAPVAQDADGIAVAVSRLGSGVVAFRQAAPSGAGARAQLLLNALPADSDEAGFRFAGARTVATAAAGGLGVPAAAIDESDDYRVAFGADGAVRLLTGGSDLPAAISDLGGAAAGEDPIVAAIDPSGGGTAAWSSRDAAGGPAVAIRQDFPSGAFQTAVVGAARSGPVGGLALGSSGLGDALVGFAQGAPGAVQIAAAVVKAPPAGFVVRVPSGWVSPVRARIGWERPASAFGGLRFDLAVDGIVRLRGLRGLSARLDRRGLDDGRHAIQAIASDGAGQQTASAVLTLRVDGTAPTARVGVVRGRRRTVAVEVTDGAGSGVRAGVTRIAFGDGGRTVRGRARATHRYGRPGTYRVVVTTSDKAGHRARISEAVTIR